LKVFFLRKNSLKWGIALIVVIILVLILVFKGI